MKENPCTTIDTWRRHAMALIDRQKTLVLATSEENHPWAAPVYYVYIEPAFYFFSSPRSKHIVQALKNSVNSAAVFSDAEQWQQLEGIQMKGRLRAIRKKLERISVTARYLRKFPMAKSLLTLKKEEAMGLSAKVSLYAFYPERVYYMNNQMGFGERIELEL